MNNSTVFNSPAEASQWLKQGNLLAYPTESVWGIGCDAYDEQAVKAILAIKNRPINKGMIVATDSADRVTSLLKPLSTVQRNLILASWQPHDSHQARQAHTWLLPISTGSQSIPKWITGRHNSVAVRVIAHPLIRELCASLVSEINPYGFLVSTSCNPSGQPPATTLNEAMAYFAHDANVTFLQGDTLGYELPSQIRDAATGKVIR